MALPSRSRIRSAFGLRWFRSHHRRAALVGAVSVAVVLGQASAALATPASPPTATVAVPESLQPVLEGQSTDAGTGSHTMHFFARTVGSSTWDLLDDAQVAGAKAFEQLPAGQLSIGQAFEYQVKDCDSTGCAETGVQTGHVSPDLAAGQRNGATRLPFTIGDKISAQVDVGTGNLFVTTTQLTLQRVSGSLDLGLAYNSLTLAPGSRFQSSISPGWRFSTGSDVRVRSNADGSVTYYGPNGLTGTFFPDGQGGYTTLKPGQLKLSLTGDTTSGWTVQDHNSGDKYDFDSSGWLTDITDRSGNKTTFTHNSVGGLGRIRTDKGTDGARTVDVQAGASQIQGLSQTPDSNDSRTVSYGYDGQGRLQTITDVLGRETTFGYNTAGDLTSVVAPGGAETGFGYDSAHRVTSVTQPAAGTAKAVTRFVYNAGQTLEADPNTDQSQPVSAVPHTTYALDGSGLMLIATATDPAGHQRAATYNNFSNVLAATNAGQTTTFGYGANGGESLTSAQAPTQAQAQFSYNSPNAPYLPDTATDTQGNQNVFTYDTNGRLSTAANGNNATATVHYNSDGTVASSEPPSGSADATTYGYVTGTKQISTITPPATATDLGTRTYTYDAYGRIRTYASGRIDPTTGQPIVQTFSYHAADRVTKIDYSDGTPSVRYTYNTAGQVATRTDASGVTTYTYDPLGRLASKVNTAGGGTLSYTYDLDGNLATETDGNGTTTDSYNSRNLLTQTTTPNGQTIAFGYNASGNRTDTWFGTNTGNTSWAAHTHTSYDHSGRISEIWTAQASNDASKGSDLSYSYAAPSTSSCPTVQVATGTDTDLRWSQTDHVTGVTTNYCYDQANRLTGVTDSTGDTWSFTYDANGNRTSATHNGTTVSSLAFDGGNEISTAGYDYDPAGNLTQTPGAVTLSYNGSDQLTGRSGGATGSYTYAGSDQTELVTQTVPGGGTWTYAYGRTDRNGLPVLDTFTNSNGTSYLIHDADGNPLALKTYQGNYSYYVLDGLGSPVALINTSGTVIATYTYDPWGNATVGNPTGSSAANLNPYRFAGGMLDRSTNYVKFGMRYYDPTTGRFTQQDSVEVIGNPTRGNRYEYAGANPSNYVDPSGRCSAESAGEVIGGSFGLVGGAESAGAGAEIGAEATTLAAGLTGGLLVGVGIGALVLGGFLISDAVSQC